MCSSVAGLGNRILYRPIYCNILQCTIYCSLERILQYIAICLRRILRYSNMLCTEATIYCSIYCSYYLLYGLIIGLIFEEVEILVSASLAMKLREYTRNTPIRRNPVSKFWKKKFFDRYFLNFWIFRKLRNSKRLQRIAICFVNANS